MKNIVITFLALFFTINVIYASNLHLIGIMVDFHEEVDDNPKTSGNGKFLEYSDYFEARCDGFLVDAPPHNANYFSSHIKAAINYYDSISNDNVDFNEGFVIDSVYTLDNSMFYYGQGDNYLVELFSEAVSKASDDIEALIDQQDIETFLITVFHAGLGQDISVPFIDPTSHDLKSAYIDEEMFLNASNVDYPVINNQYIYNGILLPETQNMIFFDVSNDIFPGIDDLCDIQLGLTGTYVFLLGYHLGLEPLFNIENGNSRIGVFGLMDVGSNNGHGVIPAPPSALTRIKAGWIIPEVINSSNLYNISARNISDQVYKINITDSEYFLIENRDNYLYDNVDIDSLRIKHKISDVQKGHFFDSIFEDQEIMELGDLGQYPFSMDSSGVITSVSNYDFGLPGSGMLIWHVDEGNIDNHDINNKLIHLEEADGAVDIGHDSMHPLFSEHVQGWEYDMWYAGNEFYLTYGNPFLDDNILIFDNNSSPSSNSNEGSLSNILIRVIDEPFSNMSFYVKLDDYFNMQFISNNEVHIVGNGIIDNTSYVYYVINENIYKINSDGHEILFSEAISDSNIVLVYNNQETLLNNTSELTYYDITTQNLLTSETYFVTGYVNSTTDLSTISGQEEKWALGDIDSDGLDEIVYVENSHLKAMNGNYTPLNGFPVPGNFIGVPLIANIYNISDNKPEIICRNGNSISVLSVDGELIYSFSSMQPNEPLSIIPNWGSDSKAAIIDGRRLIITDYDSNYSFWINPFSRTDNYPVVQRNESINYAAYQDIIQFQNAYNYPNPIKDKTTFRFYVRDSESVTINIFDLYGMLTEKLVHETVTKNEYNEITWDLGSNFNSGVFFAELIFNGGRKELIRMVVMQ